MAGSKETVQAGSECGELEKQVVFRDERKLWLKQILGHASRDQLLLPRGRELLPDSARKASCCESTYSAPGRLQEGTLTALVQLARKRQEAPCICTIGGKLTTWDCVLP
jgi:hypothetical protein